MGKMIVLTFSDSEETIFKRAVSLLADELQIEAEPQTVSLPLFYFQGGNTATSAQGVAG